jgi:hypothetical protein
MARGSSSDDRLRWGRGGGRSSSRVGEWLVVIFCFGVLAFSPLAIGMFDRGAGTRIFGIPLLYFYMFCAWALLIAAISLVIESGAESRGSRPTVEHARQRPRIREV